MGNNNSTTKKRNFNKSQKNKIKETTTNLFDKKSNEINDLKRNELEKIKNMNIDNQEDVNKIFTNLTILDTTQKQLNRGGDNFTKSDYIAIILYLNSDYDINIINSYNVEQLRSIIRLIIYDNNTINDLLSNKRIENNNYSSKNKSLDYYNNNNFKLNNNQNSLVLMN